jgi:hypothetical protein
MSRDAPETNVVCYFEFPLYCQWERGERCVARVSAWCGGLIPSGIPTDCSAWAASS